MKKLLAIFLPALIISGNALAQEGFTIGKYQVQLKVNKDASLNIAETISVHFTEPRHGIIRKIPYKYQLQDVPENVQKADRALESRNYTRTIVEKIKVAGRDYKVSTTGDFKEIKIGDKDKYVQGEQQYIISYQVLNAVNFFTDHSELYFNVIGNQWNTTIDAASFEIELYGGLSDTSNYFVATGAFGNKENNTITKWKGDKILYGHTTQSLHPYEGLTIGISFPNNFLIKPNYFRRGIYWLLLPFLVFAAMFLLWKRWGKDDAVTIQTEFYPPENISPGISGYLIDNKLNRRDLTALIPYWGAGGYLKINEVETSSLFGILKNKDYEFIKIKDLPTVALTFEKTLFNGIFKSGDHVMLSDLKNVLYVSMNAAKAELEDEISKDDYYVKYSRGMVLFFLFTGIVMLLTGLAALVVEWQEKLWYGVGLAASGLITIIIGSLMSKKTRKGTELYQKLSGFKEFIKTVEKDRLQEFLKQDENYFDKILPYAIVFNIADTWKDKLKGLEIPPPQWYTGSYAGRHFNTLLFMNSLDHSMNEMSKSFYAAPSGSGSSGGSFSGGGGFSGGGFGGGGGSSW